MPDIWKMYLLSTILVKKTDYMIYIMNSIQIALQLLAVYKH